MPAVGPDLDEAFDPSGDGSLAATGLLGQADIDNLFGPGVGAQLVEDGPPGLRVLLDHPAVKYKRLPMLEMIFEHMIRRLTTSLRNSTSQYAELRRGRIKALKFGDYMDSLQVPAMIAVFRAVPWDNYGLLTFSSELVYSIVELTMGGSGAFDPKHVDGRPFTNIELAVMERLVHLVLQDMAASFAPLTPVDFKYLRVETNPRFAEIVRPTGSAVVLPVSIDIKDLSGTLDLLFPLATLEPALDQLSQSDPGEKFGSDSIWANHLTRHVLDSSVELDVVLDEQIARMGDILRLTTGSTLPLSVKEDGLVTLRCGTVPVLRGRVAKRGNRLVILVEERATRAAGN